MDTLLGPEETDLGLRPHPSTRVSGHPIKGWLVWCWGWRGGTSAEAGGRHGLRSRGLWIPHAGPPSVTSHLSLSPLGEGVGGLVAGGVGCCLLFEICIVDASIFVAKFFRAHGGCLGIRSR